MSEPHAEPDSEWRCHFSIDGPRANPRNAGVAARRISAARFASTTRAPAIVRIWLRFAAPRTFQRTNSLNWAHQILLVKETVPALAQLLGQAVHLAVRLLLGDLGAQHFDLRQRHLRRVLDHRQVRAR